jgi:3-hydroxy-9,10-secoandrosta-1,3,5(10)-triene-9,17-dione monooxygenase reductase component
MGGKRPANLKNPAGVDTTGVVLTAEEFKRAMAQFASGVTIVTTWDAERQPTGLTASAFTSVSLDPPLVLVCVAHSAQSYPALRAAPRFAVNVLAAGQEPLSNRFATSTNGAEKFAGVAFHPGQLGLPLIDDAVAQIECATVHAYPGGDHTIFVGRVEACTCRPEAEPLLYFRGRYGRVQPAGGAR